MEELRQIIEGFAMCLEHAALYPAKCDIVEHAKDGMYGLHIMVIYNQPKRCASSSRSDRTQEEKP